MTWQRVTKDKPADNDRNVLLACNGSVIGMLTARWEDSDTEEEFWKVDNNFWDADDAPTHYLQLPPPPKE